MQPKEPATRGSGVATGARNVGRVQKPDDRSLSLPRHAADSRLRMPEHGQPVCRLRASRDTSSWRLRATG